MPWLHMLCLGGRASSTGPGIPSFYRRVAVTAVVALLTLWQGTLAQECFGATYAVEQDQIKAVYLYNFLHVTTWPDDRQREKTPSPMVIGVLGASPLNAALDDLAASVRKGKKAAIDIVHFGPFREGMDVSGCHVLFVSALEKENFEKITESLKHAPVLTVADSEYFLDAGGMIVLVEQQNRVRYRVNRHAVSSVGLRLSSQLLQAAISVDGD